MCRQSPAARHFGIFVAENHASYFESFKMNTNLPLFYLEVLECCTDFQKNYWNAILPCSSLTSAVL